MRNDNTRHSWELVTSNNMTLLTLTSVASERLRSAVTGTPGTAPTGVVNEWEVQLNPTTARALRATLTGENGVISPETRTLLRTLANDLTPEIVTTGSRTIVTIPHSAATTQHLQKMNAAWTGKQWELPETVTQREIAAFQKQHNLLPAKISNPTPATAGELNYDHTIAGLRGVLLTEIMGIPARKVPAFAAFGVTNAETLINLVPRRYVDRSQLTPIARIARDGTEQTIIGKIRKVIPYDRNRRITKFVVGDNTAGIEIVYFNSPWVGKKFTVGDEVIVHGKPETKTWNSKQTVTMSNPLMDLTGNTTAPIVPVYPQSAKAKITTWDIFTAAEHTITQAGEITDPVPESVLQRNNFPTRTEAYRAVHRPNTVTEAKTGRDRLAFDELFRVQLALLMTKHATATQKGVTHTPTGHLTAQFVTQLPYTMTNAQKAACLAITKDLQHPNPMQRLLQGDVGAGKTLVAAYTLLTAAESGYQTALMAPTEILAWQLYKEIANLTTHIAHPNGNPVTVAYLAGKTTAKQRKTLLPKIETGEIDITIGTHALLTDTVTFANLGLIIIDEQHRFGVEQRAKLRTKGPNQATPDMLTMTATPIPRTAALTVFGDLDVTTLNELPPGRTPIETIWVQHDPDLNNPHVEPWVHIREEIHKGHQAYIVCPIVEGSENIQAADATATFQHLTTGALAGLTVGLVHGQMKPAERDETMTSFKNGNINVLVATTVIEVGVNVPNATTMTVLNAERFGLAQLHQLRGRVGRASYQSTCYLIANPPPGPGTERLTVMESTTNGFIIAEEDLRIRGEGSLLGTTQAQAGISDLTVASFKTDQHLIHLARAEAETLLTADPKLSRHPTLRGEIMHTLGEKTIAWVTKI
jgi:ATP-dependent DNA helicase RecG